jgi:predicted  nucleic acid-binding Zn-ribbon protein
VISVQDQKALLALRDLDRQTDRLRERALVIPRELDRLNKELSVHQEFLDDEERRLADLRLDRSLAEREIEEAKKRRREIEEKQFRIRNNQEYQANLREVETMKEKASQSDERAVEILIQEEDVVKEIDRLRLIVQEEQRKHGEASGRLRAELAVVQAELDAKEADRKAAVASLSPPLRSRYERIHKSKGDLAIVGVEEGSCGGCGAGLPPQRLQEVRRSREIILCEGCGRILVVGPDEI